MKAPEFIHKKTDGIFEYHLPAPYKRFLNRLVSDSGFRLEEEIRDELLQFISGNAISSFGGWDENAILYSLALEILAKDKTCFLVYFDQQKAIESIQKKAHSQHVEWRNAIHFMEGMQYCEQLEIQSPTEFLNAVNYSDKDLTDRYFYMSEIKENNLHLFPRLYHSDVSNWFFLFCEQENKESIRSLLTNTTVKPDMAAILEQCSSTVTIQIGGDEGYLDYVLIQSQKNLSSCIRKIEASQKAFKHSYENLLSECQPFDHEWKMYVYLDRFQAILDEVRKME